MVEPWSVRRSAILSRYTTSEKLSIVTSFLPGGEKGIYFFKRLTIELIFQSNLYISTQYLTHFKLRIDKWFFKLLQCCFVAVVVKVQPSGPMVDKVKTRLEQLDDFEEGSVRQMLDLSQQQYTARIEQLNNELVQAWHSDQRVKALKIAIQVSIRSFNSCARA